MDRELLSDCILLLTKASVHVEMGSAGNGVFVSETIDTVVQCLLHLYKLAAIEEHNKKKETTNEEH